MMMWALTNPIFHRDIDGVRVSQVAINPRALLHPSMRPANEKFLTVSGTNATRLSPGARSQETAMVSGDMAVALENGVYGAPD
jgi:hypothetical protein